MENYRVAANKISQKIFGYQWSPKNTGIET